MKIVLGYMIASRRVMQEGARVRYFYRERPDSDADSGWRVFAGDESDEYVNDARNLAMYNASTVIAIAPEIKEFLAEDYPVAFERESDSAQFQPVSDERDEQGFS